MLGRTSLLFVAVAAAAAVVTPTRHIVVLSIGDREWYACTQSATLDQHQ
jgi:hypothetical protein